MLKTKKGIALIAAASFALGVAAFPVAETTIKDITAQVNYGMKIALNGNQFAPVDDDGTALKPIIYKGRSYLPVRAIADALKVAVDYDDASQTIILGERAGKGVSLLDVTDDYIFKGAKTYDQDMLSVNNKTYDNGIYINDINDSSSSFKSKLDKRFQKLNFKIAAVGDKAVEGDIKDKDTGIVLKHLEINPGDATMDVEVNVAGVNNLEISFVNTHWSDVVKRVIIAEPYLK